MRHVLLVAPHLAENTQRYVRAFTGLDDVKLSVISSDPITALATPLAQKVASHNQIDRCLDAAALTHAAYNITQAQGPIDRVTGMLEQLQEPLAHVRDALGIEGLSSRAARNFRDKNAMKDVLRAHDVPVASSALIGSMRSVRRWADTVGYPIVIKPQSGLGARATYRINSERDLDALEAQGIAPSRHAPLQVEQFIRAREHTCETVTIRGEPVWHSGTRYLPSPLEVLESPWMQYCVLLPREDAETVWTRFHPTNARALRALLGDEAHSAAGTALTHMEWFVRDNGSALVNEVGIRPPGVLIMQLMSIAHETDFYASWAELIACDRFRPPTRRWSAGAAFFRGQGYGTRVAEVQGIEAAIEAAGDALVELRAPKVGQHRADGYEGEGWATVRSATTEGAKQALLALIERVRIRYA